MTRPGSEDNPLRVAIIGAGPTGFYAAEHLFKQPQLNVQVDLYDRLPTPFGLVRGGVAPDHQKIKNVTRVYDRIASNPAFRFFGNVDFGTHLHLDDLRAHYHQILFATGAQTDRNLGIPGEDLDGSHSATAFVAWYNGHPDFRECRFDLSAEAVAVVGVGNVAVDVARILCRTTDELAETDIADYALDALRESKVRTVYMLGRRGLAQAAFTNPEIKELGEMPSTDVVVVPEEAQLDDVSRATLEREPDRMVQKKIEIVQNYAAAVAEGRARRLVLRFLVSPVEILGDENGRVRAIRLVRNELYEDEKGIVRCRPTGAYEEVPVQLVFRSVGYVGVPLPEVPFDERRGVIRNERGRVLEGDSGQPVTGLYAAGWIKRGATGVIGTNKPDAAETVDAMLEDLERGRTLAPVNPRPEQLEALLAERQPAYFTFSDWQRLDELETCSGAECGRPRVKFTSVEEMLEALGRNMIEAAPQEERREG